jgi:hypothetical protein
MLILGEPLSTYSGPEPKISDIAGIFLYKYMTLNIVKLKPDTVPLARNPSIQEAKAGGPPTWTS